MIISWKIWHRVLSLILTQSVQRNLLMEQQTLVVPFLVTMWLWEKYQRIFLSCNFWSRQISGQNSTAGQKYRKCYKPLVLMTSFTWWPDRISEIAGSFSRSYSKSGSGSGTDSTWLYVWPVMVGSNQSGGATFLLDLWSFSSIDSLSDYCSCSAASSTGSSLIGSLLSASL